MKRFCASSIPTTPPRLAELGTSCPDHFLRTKIKPLYVDWDPRRRGCGGPRRTKLHDRPREVSQRITRLTTTDASDSNSPAMRDPNPTVMLVPGLGMIAWGKDKSESRVTAEFYNCAVEVMRGAEAIDEYIALPQQEAFDIEYWLLEEAKLKRMPAEKELARQVDRRHRRGFRHREGNGASARQRRRASRLRRSEQRRGRGDREGNH